MLGCPNEQVWPGILNNPNFTEGNVYFWVEKRSLLNLKELKFRTDNSIQHS